MKTEVEKLEDGRMMLTVEVPVEEFDKDLKSAYKRVAKQIRIPGFRKGHIPQSIIDSRVGPAAVLDEMAEEAIPRFYKDAVQESQVEPIDYPEIELHTLKTGEPLVFKAKIQVRPTATLGQYKDLTVAMPPKEVSDDEVEERLKLIQDRFAELVVQEDRAAELGDYILCDYTVGAGDRLLDELKVTDYMMRLGADDIAKEFTDAVIGAKVGDVRPFKMMLPATHPNKKVAGKEIEITVTVKEVKIEEKPDIDDEFAKRVSEFDTIAEYRADIKSKLQERKDETYDQDFKRQVARAAVSHATFTVPPVMVDDEIDSMIRRFSAPLLKEGQTLEEYLKASGMTREMLESQFRKTSAERVERELVFEAIAEAEGIEVTDEDVDADIREAAEAEGSDFQELKEQVEKLGRRREVERRIRMEKALDVIVATASSTEVPLDEYNDIVDSYAPQSMMAGAAEPETEDLSFGGLAGQRPWETPGDSPWSTPGATLGAPTDIIDVDAEEAPAAATDEKTDK